MQSVLHQSLWQILLHRHAFGLKYANYKSIRLTSNLPNGTAAHSIQWAEGYGDICVVPINILNISLSESLPRCLSNASLYLFHPVSFTLCFSVYSQGWAEWSSGRAHSWTSGRETGGPDTTFPAERPGDDGSQGELAEEGGGPPGTGSGRSQRWHFVIYTCCPHFRGVFKVHSLVIKTVTKQTFVRKQKIQQIKKTFFLK